MTDRNTNLLGGRKLARNVIWNLLGAVIPILVAIIAIPILIKGLGSARFGVLTLAWVVVGYFSLFDLGLGRALTKLVAEKLGKGQNDDIPSLIWTAMSMMLVLGVIGAIVVSAISSWLVSDALNIPLKLQPETIISLYMLAASIPIVISTTGLRGVLEAHQRFGLVNAVRIPLGISTFLGPMAVLPFSDSLIPVVAVLVIIRLIFFCVYLTLCLNVEPKLRKMVKVRRDMIMALISFGGWMTISYIVGPILVYMDRFIIGSVVTMAAVAYYATPNEIVTKLSIISNALMGVIFPAFAASFAQDRTRAAFLFNQAINYIFIILFPIVLIMVTFSFEALSLWVGKEFAFNSSLVMKLLVIGAFINSFAYVPLGLIQAAGRPDLTAKLHLTELPFYLLVLWWLLGAYGIVGAAIAWVLRATVDAIALFFIAQKLSPSTPLFSLRHVYVLSVALLILVLGSIISTSLLKVLFLIIVLFVFAIFSWFIILNTDERDLIRNRLKTIPFN
ncbi:flippase [uncultured Cocleimonas sp.]|uniref:flippase n=1 Tax=uncultured Cocleimonas sp. TaxID=1051587 RepID=UPI002621376D|nr:flippase [uncultured Cocleimonas sp.]